jgi:mannosyltransferase
MFATSERTRLILATIILTGLFLRTYDLSTESLWCDELTSIKLAHMNLKQILQDRMSKTVVNPPLYFYILHYWIKVFGDTGFSVRLPSVIFGTLSVYMIYKIGALLFDEETGIISSLLLAVSVFHIHYSQDARMYSLLVLLSTLSMYMFLKFLKKEDLKTGISYILSSTLMIYNHFYGLLIILAQNIYAITLIQSPKANQKPNLKKWFILQASIGILYSPWIIPMLDQLSRITETGSWISEWLGAPSTHTLINTFVEYSGSIPLLLIFLILYLNSITVNGKHNLREHYLLWLWLLTPIIIPAVFSHIIVPVYVIKYGIPASLAFYIQVAKGIRDIKHRLSKHAVTAVIIAISLLNILNYYTVVDKEEWREVLGYINDNARPRDLLIYPKYINDRGIFDYYLNRTDLILRPLPMNFFTRPNERRLDAIKEKHDRIWMIYNMGGDASLINASLTECHNISYYGRFVGETFDNVRLNIDLYLFERK